MLPARFGDGEFVARDVEGRAFPAIGGLHFDEAVGSVGVEAFDVEAGTIAVQMRHPANAAGKVGSARSHEVGMLVRQNALFAGSPQGVIAVPGSVILPVPRCDQFSLWCASNG